MFSASQKIPRKLWNENVHYRIHASHLSPSWATSIQSITRYSTSWRSFLILPSHLFLGLPSSLFHSGYPTKTHHTLLLSPIQATCLAHHILSILSPEKYWVRSTDQSVLYEVSSTLLSPRPTYTQVFSSTPYSQTSWIWVIIHVQKYT